MSGKRQHYIPRFLQSGFVSHSTSYGAFTWVYRKDTQPFNTNIINTGVEGHFYSHEGDNQADDDITAAETGFCELIEALRQGSNEATIDTFALAELISHLEIRTRHLRQSLTISSGIFMDELFRFIADQQAFGNYMKRRYMNDPSFIHGPLADEFKKRNIPDSLIPQILDSCQPLLEQMLPSILSDLSLMADHFRAEIPRLAINAAKSGHIKVLKETLSPPAKTSQYLALKFSLIRSDNVALPLGDSAVVFHLSGQRPYKAFCEKDDPIQAVYLPLTPSLILVGSIDDKIPDLSRIPMAIAQCSLEYFISASRTSANDILHTHIGEFAYLLTEEQICDLVTKLSIE